MYLALMDLTETIGEGKGEITHSLQMRDRRLRHVGMYERLPIPDVAELRGQSYKIVIWAFVFHKPPRFNSSTAYGEIHHAYSMNHSLRRVIPEYRARANPEYF